MISWWTAATTTLSTQSTGLRKTQLRKLDTIGAFKIFTEIVKQPEAVMPIEVPIINNTNILTEAKVWVLVQLKSYYFGHIYNVKDLQWLQEVLEQSCEVNLIPVKMIEWLRCILDEEQGGGILYYIINQLTQMDTEQAIWVVTDKLE